MRTNDNVLNMLDELRVAKRNKLNLIDTPTRGDLIHDLISKEYQRFTRKQGK